MLVDLNGDDGSYDDRWEGMVVMALPDGSRWWNEANIGAGKWTVGYNTSSLNMFRYAEAEEYLGIYTWRKNGWIFMHLTFIPVITEQRKQYFQLQVAS